MDAHVQEVGDRGGFGEVELDERTKALTPLIYLMGRRRKARVGIRRSVLLVATGRTTSTLYLEMHSDFSITI